MELTPELPSDKHRSEKNCAKVPGATALFRCKRMWRLAFFIQIISWKTICIPKHHIKFIFRKRYIYKQFWRPSYLISFECSPSRYKTRPVHVTLNLYEEGLKKRTVKLIYFHQKDVWLEHRESFFTVVWIAECTVCSDCVCVYGNKCERSWTESRMSTSILTLYADVWIRFQRRHELRIHTMEVCILYWDKNLYLKILNQYMWNLHIHS